MRPIRVLSLLSVLALGLAGCGTSSSGTAGPAAEQAETSAPSAVATGGESYTMEQVAEHDDDESCWTVIEGEVYDVTRWMVRHPGGPDRIRGLCGRDGTRNFTGQHEGEERPATRLAEFRIGTLQD